jgi:spermidine/putrescine transport system ATP-binding protein
MSDRIAVMDAGVVQQCGRPQEIYEQPAKPFVAGFIGISNLLPGRVENGRVRLATGTDHPAPDDCPAGTDVQVSVRPEHVMLHRETGIPGTVAERIYVGTATQLIVELEGGARIVALTRENWDIGDRIAVSWRPEDARVLR